MSGEFWRDYERVAVHLGAAEGAGLLASAYARSVQSALDSVAESVLAGSRNAKDIHYAKGDAAEYWHAGTYNVDAVRQGMDGSAWAPRDGTVEDVVFGMARESPVQLKYYRTPEHTAKAISHPAYEGLDKVVPSDQLDETRRAAERLAATYESARPEQAASYWDTVEGSSDRLSHDGAQSRPLSEPEARELVEDAREDGELDLERWGLTAAQTIQLQDLARVALEAGMQAAALSAALQLAPVVAAAVQQALVDGELDLDALATLAHAVPGAALRSGVSGSLTAALVTATQSGMLGPALTALPPGAIAAVVVLSINCLQVSYRAATGEIPWDQATSIMAKDGLVLAGAMLGGALGQLVIPVPVLGALIGNLVGATLARMAISHGESFYLGLAITRGWATFGLVTHDYEMPPDVLAAIGWDPLDVDAVTVETPLVEPLRVDSLDVDPFIVNGTPMRVLSRGFVSVGVVGYR